MKFTEKQIKAAKEVKEEVIHGILYDWRHIYMAGEICMWDEIQQAKVNDVDTSHGKALNLAGVSGSVLDFYTDLMKLINAYCDKGLKKPDLVHKMEYATESCKLS
jgi:hypothetical protein